ncbi:unnamed protein product [Paramecium primaurelia]|uniref:DNA replication factor Dna2 N-terminal domain-containing protein n=1 Tax=Paramecium primaurelia TaxID=5886 RepID=A0A8S1P3E5_PARPR|nr:unnamed protein product [Paramecium primaurelia]
MFKQNTNKNVELEEVFTEENRPTKKLLQQSKQQIVNRENLINNSNQITINNQNLIVKDVLNSNEILKNDYVLSIVEKAKKNKDSNFLLIIASEKLNFRNDEKNIEIFLFDHYYNLNKITKGMQIRLNGGFIDSRIIIFTKDIQNNNSFTLEPEKLISPTTLNNLTFCRRKQFIKDFFLNQNFGTTIEMLGGKIIHEFCQDIIKDLQKYKSLFENIEVLDKLQNEQHQIKLDQIPQSFIEPISLLYQKYLSEFYYLEKKTIIAMIIFILPSCVNTLKWIQQYIINQQSINIKQQQTQDVYQIYILRWISNEQKLSSSIYGFNGFPDIVVEVKFRKNFQQFQNCFIPLELKTGKKSENYEQQVQTYLLLMNNFYKQNSQFGLIVYLKEFENSIVTCSQKEINELFFYRNLYIAETYMFEKSINCYSKLPDLKDELQHDRQVNKCNKCEYKSICYGLHILTEQSELTLQIPYYDQVNQQLQQKSKNYLNEMLKNLRLEEQSSNIPQVIYFIQETKTHQDGIQIILQSKNYYLKQQANQILQQCKQDIKNKQQKLFCIRQQHNVKYTLQNAWLSKGYQIINLVEDQTDQEEHNVEDLNFDYAIRLQIVLENELHIQSENQLQIYDEFIYKNSSKHFFKHQKFIIFELAINKDFYQRKKEILIFGMEPIFKPITEIDDNQKYAFAILREKFQNNLNEYQIKAIELCLLAQDFALIQGQYGKKRMLSHLLFLLGYTNKKVLYYAADQEVLDEQIIDFIQTFPNESEWVLRLQGKHDKVPENLQQYSFIFEQFTNLTEVENKLEDKHFYFSTCQYCTDILQSQSFDYCIVDQSTKITEPQCISCILKSKVFILLEDQEQQQPLIKSQKAKQLKISLFQRLSQQFKNVGCQQELEFSFEDIEDLI